MIPEAPEYISIKIKEEEKLLSLVWLRNVNSAEYRQALCLVKQLILQHNVRLWLSDSRKLANVPFEDQQWLTNKLAPELVASSLQKVARVVHSDIFTYISFEQQMHRAHQVYISPIEAEQFTSVEAALSWLYMKD